MTQIARHEPGTFCWVELSTTDPKDARRFYGDLFGWSGVEVPMEGTQFVYNFFKKEEDDVAGFYLQMPDQKAMGIPPNWMSYVAVASADDAAKRVRELGGTVLAEPMDVQDSGRMSILQDPQGATFGVWQPSKHIGSRRWNEPNAPCWNELLTSDVAKAGEFYGGLFGWTGKVGGDYTEFSKGKNSFAGMMAIKKEWGGMPPNWGYYVRVEDTDAAAKKAASLGGKIHVPPTDIENVGRFAMLADPQGAVFSVIWLSPNAANA